MLVFRHKGLHIVDCPRVFLHIFASIGIDSLWVVLQESVQIAVYQLRLYAQISAFNLQYFFDSGVSEGFPQGTDNDVQVFLHGSIIGRVLPKRREDVGPGNAASVAVDQVGQ